MNKSIKNSFAGMQRIAVAIGVVCVLFFMPLGCRGYDSDEGDADINAFVGHLKSASYDIIPKESMPEWLVVRINDYYETRPPSICKVQIYKGKWDNQTVYFILDTFSSCLCDFYNENGERIRDENLSLLHVSIKNWILIYEYGESVLDLDELLKN